MAERKKPIFIYFRHTPQGMKFIPSYDNSPMGESKRLIPHSDPNSQMISTFLNALIGVAKRDGVGGRGGVIPTAAIMQRYLDSAKAMMLLGNGYDDILMLPRMGNMGARFMFRPAPVAE